jgi:DNA-binding MarR family transcriptional regulator
MSRLKAMTRGRKAAATLDQGLYEGLAGFRYALRQFMAFSEAVTREAGVTSQQYQALLVIKTHLARAIMIRDLADQMLLPHNGAVQLIDRLVDADLAKRMHSSTDRRRVLVAMTKKGEKVLERLAANHIAELLMHEPILAESLKRLRRMGRRGTASTTG